MVRKQKALVLLVILSLLSPLANAQEELHAGGQLIASYVADAHFSHDPYAKASPWEDYAEAFCEYLFLPERLIEHAPEKFQFLEEEFKRYSNNEALMQRLEAALERGGDHKDHDDHENSLPLA